MKTSLAAAPAKNCVFLSVFLVAQGREMATSLAQRRSDNKLVC
jgi:hypothetical protein